LISCLYVVILAFAGTLLGNHWQQRQNSDSQVLKIDSALQSLLEKYVFIDLYTDLCQMNAYKTFLAYTRHPAMGHVFGWLPWATGARSSLSNGLNGFRASSSLSKVYLTALTQKCLRVSDFLKMEPV